MTVIDCNTCPVRGRHCGQCFVPVVAGAWLDQGYERRQPAGVLRTPAPRVSAPEEREEHHERLPLTDAEWEAVDAFIGAGLINTMDVLDLAARTEPTPIRSWQQVG
ncbi:MAG: hypothetical protein WBG57_07445 [Ornithinimicrobium sp.]